MNTITMRCADEPGFPVREFHPDGPDDFVCSHCRWMQTSFAAGLRELANCGTWTDEEERKRYLALADAQTAPATGPDPLPDSNAR